MKDSGFKQVQSRRQMAAQARTPRKTLQSSERCYVQRVVVVFGFFCCCCLLLFFSNSKNNNKNNETSFYMYISFGMLKEEGVARPYHDSSRLSITVQSR